MAEVSGYPVPAGADETTFPYESAADIANWASKAGDTLARAMLDKVRDCLGHPERIRDLAVAWAPDASGMIHDANEGIVRSKADLTAYWEGAAFEAFRLYIDHVSRVVQDTAVVMNDMSELSWNLRRTITETYKAGIEFIGDCAVALVDAAGTVVQNLANIVGAVCQAILEALQGFVGAVTDLMSKSAEIMGEYEEAGGRLRARAAELSVPDTVPSAVGESENWRVRRVGR